MRCRLLLVGMSHTNAIRHALTEAELSCCAVVNVNMRPEAFAADGQSFDMRAFPDWRPDVVVLSISGNTHNILGLFNHPRPFAIGHPVRGRVPADPDLAFIPQDVARAFLTQKIMQRFAPFAALHSHYAGVPFVHLSAPAPVGDEDHIRANPGSFAEVLHMGISPPDLRMALFDLQTDIFAERAAQHGAAFLLPPREALTDTGFLGPGYVADDPTHGNAAYGRLVLNQIDALMEEMA
jgi:hypothetical protein